MTYFLWGGIFVTNQVVFGYTQPQIITYIFLVLAVQAVVLSAPSGDNIGGEIRNGDLSNYLVKPLGYLKFWFTRDLASKLLNLLFATFEVTLLWFIFKPDLSLPFSLVSIFGFLLSAVLATVIYYFLSVSARFMAFWTPENTWGLAFVILVFTEMLGGSIFPLNILPGWAYLALQLTPFPYLVYFPVAILSGKIVGWAIARVLAQGLVWSILMFFGTKWLWRKGLVVYQASGR